MTLEPPNRVLEEIKEKVREASLRVARLRSVHTPMTETVSSAFATKLDGLMLATKDSSRWKIPLLLRRDEVNDIGNSLLIDGAYGYQTWLHRDLLNSLIFELKEGKVMHPHSPFFYIPQQTKRRLIVAVEKKTWDDTDYVRKLRDSLLAFEVGDFTNNEEKEIDCVCSFVAAACIFGKILFPGFEKKLLKLTSDSVSLNPPFVMLPLKNEENVKERAFYRYFLPPPASIYLLRYILFCFKNIKRLGIADIMSANFRLFGSFLGRTEDCSSVFKNWLKKRMAVLNCEGFDGMDISSFREACLMSSVLDYGTVSQGLSSYPPLFYPYNPGR